VDNGQACEHKDAPKQAKYKRVEVYNSGWRIRKGWYTCNFRKQDFKTLQSPCQVSRLTIYFLFRFPFTVCTKSTCLYGFLICFFHGLFCMFMKVGIMYTNSGRIKNMLAALIM
jgi:hypothetical protein